MAALPTRVFAGVTIPDTPLITKALEYTRAHSTDFAYNHVQRSMLFGFVMAAKVPSLQDRDQEVHAIAALMHDIGWDVSSRSACSALFLLLGGLEMVIRYIF